MAQVLIDPDKAMADTGDDVEMAGDDEVIVVEETGAADPAQGDEPSTLGGAENSQPAPRVTFIEYAQFSFYSWRKPANALCKAILNHPSSN